MQPDNCGPTYIVIGDGGNEEGVEDDFTNPQAAWHQCLHSHFAQLSFVIKHSTTAEWAGMAADGPSIDAVSLCTLH